MIGYRYSTHTSSFPSRFVNSQNDHITEVKKHIQPIAADESNATGVVYDFSPSTNLEAHVLAQTMVDSLVIIRT